MLKTELSSRNPYKLPKHRYLELKHWCLQYPEWKRIYTSLERCNEISVDIFDPTAKLAILRTDCRRCMDLLENTAFGFDTELGSYIFKAVTKDLSFNQLKLLDDIPCERDMYYSRYRKFFWLLSMAKGM